MSRNLCQPLFNFVNAYVIAAHHVFDIFDQNTIRLNEIIEQYRWPTRNMIGKDGTWMAWAIAQHSHDLNFQKKCLKLLENTLSTNEPEPVLYAELNDRICRNTNQKQKFGMPLSRKMGLKNSIQ